MNFVLGIYNYIAKNRNGNETGPEACYYLIHVLDENGRMDYRVLDLAVNDMKEYQIEVLDDSQMIGPFEDLSLLGQFAYSLCEASEKDRFILLSVEDYNQLAESSSDKKQLIDSLMKSGHHIERKESGKKGFLGRIFT